MNIALHRRGLEDVDSEADYVLFSESEGVLSEHCTQGEARIALFQQARCQQMGDSLPRIYRREGIDWLPLS